MPKVHEVNWGGREKVKSESEVAQSCPTLSDLMDYSLPGWWERERRSWLKGHMSLEREMIGRFLEGLE